MSQPSRNAETEFDAYAAEYDVALAQGIRLSGEDKNYFAKGRIAWLAHCLAELGEIPRTAMDFGCGTGSSLPLLSKEFALEWLLGVDPSVESLAIAERDHGGDRIAFARAVEFDRGKQIDLAFCNGVFHHIPPDDRGAAVNSIFSSLRRGGLFAFWENNPWNPGTRYIMTRIPFDRDARTLALPEAMRLLREGGFEVVRTDFLFFFPKLLSWLRPLEPRLTRMPLGAQYQVLCRKPADASEGFCRPDRPATGHPE